MNGIRHAVGRRTAIVGLANIRQPLSRGCRIGVGRVPDLADVEIAFKEVNRMFNEEECSDGGGDARATTDTSRATGLCRQGVRPWRPV